jgi:hypothetical protein
LAGHVLRMGEKRPVYRLLVGKPEGQRPLGRPRRKLEDNIKMDLKRNGMGCGLDSSGPGHRALSSTCKHGNNTSNSIIC